MLNFKSLRTAKYPFALTVEFVQSALEAGSFPTQQAKKELNEVIARCYENDTREAITSMPELKTRMPGALSYIDVPNGVHEFGKKARALFAADVFAPYIAQIDVLQELRAQIKAAPIVKPEPRLAHVNPNKDVKTCACCFRAIAVQGGTMAHHGYQRTGWGFQTASCMGISYPPLEVSDAGLRAKVNSLRTMLEQANKELARLNSPTAVQSLTTKTKKGELVLVRGTPEFERALRVAQANKESEIRQLGYMLATFETKLAEWKAAA